MELLKKPGKARRLCIIFKAFREKLQAEVTEKVFQNGQ